LLDDDRLVVLSQVAERCVLGESRMPEAAILLRRLARNPHRLLALLQLCVAIGWPPRTFERIRRSLATPGRQPAAAAGSTASWDGASDRSGS